MIPLIECVPNFSEGRDEHVIANLATAASSVFGAALLDRTSDFDHNRTVLTIAGSPEAVAESAFRAVQMAARSIHMPAHTGVHPRIGAADVVPFVPVGGCDLTGCAQLATAFGERVWRELGVPVFLYEASARDAAHARLETLRSAKFIGEPDFGNGRHPTAGAVITGARQFLVAWNIWLDTDDLSAAKTIARAVRAANGGLPAVKALGLALPSRRRVQVSINLVDFEITSVTQVFRRVSEAAASLNAAVLGCELIGLIPERALAAARYLRWLNPLPIEDYILENRLRRANLLN